MLIKVIVLILFAIILGSLASGLAYLVKDQGEGKRTVKALTIRIAVSVIAFLLLMAGYATGLIRPHGLLPTPPAESSGSSYIQ